MTLDVTGYRDLTGVVRLVPTAPGRDVRDEASGIALHGNHPVAGHSEQEIARFGGQATLSGNRSDGAGTDLGLGLVAEGGGELLVTSERLVVSLWIGKSILGAMTETRVLLFAIPWDLIDMISRPIKKTLADRIAGGQKVSMMGMSDALVNLDFIASSVFAPPPRSEPVAGADAAGTMEAVVGAAAAYRLRNATGTERARLERVSRGQWDTEDGDVVGWLVNPEEEDRPAPAPSPPESGAPVPPSPRTIGAATDRGGLWFGRFRALGPGERKVAAAGSMAVEAPYLPQPIDSERVLVRVAAAVALRTSKAEVASGRAELIVTDRRVAGVIWEGRSSMGALSQASALGAFSAPWGSETSVTLAPQSPGHVVRLRTGEWEMTWDVTEALKGPDRTRIELTNQQVVAAWSKLVARAWPDAVTASHPRVVQETTAPSAPATRPPGAAPSRLFTPPARSDVPASPSAPAEEESLLRLGAMVIGQGVIDLALWLAPVVIVGGLGLVLFSAGSTETTTTWGQTSTEVGRVGWLGIALVCVAVVLFAGRGTFLSLARVIRGNGGFADVVFIPSSLRAALFALAGTAGAVLSLLMAITG